MHNVLVSQYLDHLGCPIEICKKRPTIYGAVAETHQFQGGLILFGVSWQPGGLLFFVCVTRRHLWRLKTMCRWSTKEQRAGYRVSPFRASRPLEWELRDGF